MLTTDMQTLQEPARLVDAALASKKRTVDWVMDYANRDRAPLTCHPDVYLLVSTQGALDGGFCWDPSGTTSNDDDGPWIPQGITTTRDALGANEYDGHQLIGVSWYYEDQSRLTLVDWDADWDNKYRHILFVEPTGGAGLFKNANTHAGGIMWYGDLLYVADSTNKGFRIFGFDNIYSADTNAFCEDTVGKVYDSALGGYRYCASGYAYMMVQIGWVKLSSNSRHLRLSTISLDRSTAPDTFVIAEYSDPSKTRSDAEDSNNRYHPRAVRWELDATSRLPAASMAVDALSTNIMRMQGVTARYGKHYFASSNGSLPGALRSWDQTSDTVRKTDWVIGAESLSYWGGSPDLIWTCTEHENGRVVIGARVSDLDL
ncbi:MAG TPA: hypothetical protein VNM90_21595 [Haliangium sp.]|nr:hypothetical protein [Haliangium sp.]